MEQVKPLTESEEAYARAQWLHPTDLRLFATLDAERARRVEAEKALAGDSPTWPYVLAFARLMEAKLAANRHKGDRDGWLAMSPLDLLARAQGELGELTAALADWHGAELDREPYSDEDRARFRRAAVPEAADVANFAMMIADTCGALSAESIAATVRP